MIFDSAKVEHTAEHLKTSCGTMVGTSNQLLLRPVCSVSTTVGQCRLKCSQKTPPFTPPTVTHSCYTYVRHWLLLSLFTCLAQQFSPVQVVTTE